MKKYRYFHPFSYRNVLQNICITARRCKPPFSSLSYLWLDFWLDFWLDLFIPIMKYNASENILFFSMQELQRWVVPFTTTPFVSSFCFNLIFESRFHVRRLAILGLVDLLLKNFITFNLNWSRLSTTKRTQIIMLIRSSRLSSENNDDLLCLILV